MLNYIIAFLALLNLLLGGYAIYYKSQYNKAVDYKIQAEQKLKEHQQYLKIVEEQREEEKKLADDKYKLEISSLSLALERLRKQTDGSSLLPKASTTTRNPEEISFDRKKLDMAIQEYRTEIQRLIGIGTECQIELNNAREWAKNAYNE